MPAKRKRGPSAPLRAKAVEEAPFDDTDEIDNLKLEKHQKILDLPSPPIPTNIHKAIETAPVNRLRELLIDLIDKQPEAKVTACKKLLIPLNGIGKPGKRRKAYEACKNCKVEYTVSENKIGCCVFHKGKKRYNASADIWTDTYWEGDRPSDYQDDPMWEEGYQWTCCRQTGAAKGCIVSRHEVDLKLPKPIKKRRAEDDDDDSEQPTDEDW